MNNTAATNGHRITEETPLKTTTAERLRPGNLVEIDGAWILVSQVELITEPGFGLHGTVVVGSPDMARTIDLPAQYRMWMVA